MMKKIFIITNKDDITVDFIVRLLRQDGVDYYRFNTEELFNSIDIRFRIDESHYILFDKVKQKEINLDDFSAVYFRRPGIPDFKRIKEISEIESRYLTREALSVLDGIYKRLERCFWINDVFKIREAENKLYQLEIAKKLGFSIPKTILSNDAVYMRERLDSEEESEFVIKAVRSGNIDPETAKRIIFTTDVSVEEITEKSVSGFPAYIQAKISKRSDLRCIVVGNKVFTAEILSQNDSEARTDWRKSSKVLEHRQYELPIAVKERCIAITRELGLVYSAIDFALDVNGNHIFLECNPNGQWAWIESRLGFPISRTIEGLLLNGGIT